MPDTTNQPKKRPFTWSSVAIVVISAVVWGLVTGQVIFGIAIGLAIAIAIESGRAAAIRKAEKEHSGTEKKDTQ